MNRTYLTIILFFAVSTAVFGEGLWIEVEPMNSPRMGHAAAVTDGMIYVFGGISNDLRNMMTSAEVYNTGNDTWREIESLPMPLYQATAVALDGYIFLFGGVTTRGGQNDMLYRYSIEDDEGGEYEMIGRMHESMRSAHGSVVVDNRILIIGGKSGERDYLNGGYWFYPESQRWLEAPSLNRPRADFGLTVRNGIVWAVGGLFFGPLDRLEVLQRDEWIIMEPMPNPRGSLGAVFLNNVLIAAGGTTSDGITNLVETYRPEDDEWSDDFPDMIQPRMDFALVCVRDSLYAIGGRSTDQRRPVLSSVEKWVNDPVNVSNDEDYATKSVNISVQPNPANGFVNFRLPTVSAVLKIMDLNGRSIVVVPVENGSGFWTWDCSRYPAGIYLYQYRTLAGGKFSNGKILVVK
ncbi:T9SS type A sorting domain-containing protein [bacterium]|nr:T9SS type A sorting domain-containing protein [bacterium]